MPRTFLAPDFVPNETSAKLVFSGNRLDRLSEDRADDCVETALANPASRLIGIARGRVLMTIENDEPRGLLTIEEIAGFSPRLERATLLGFDHGAPRLAVPLGLNLDAEDFELAEGWKALDFRSLAIQGLLSHEELGQVAQGAAYLAWHSSARYCGRCGAETKMRGGGVKRHCPSCERDTFPRTDPVVIMLTPKVIIACLAVPPIFRPACIPRWRVLWKRVKLSKRQCVGRRLKNPAFASAMCAIMQPSRGPFPIRS